jgi:hypothetical protein
MHNPAPDLREHAPDVPPEIADIVLRCLNKAPEERPESCDMVVKVLKAVARAKEIDY